MAYTYKDYKVNADIIKSHIGSFKPEVLMVLGSGLGFMADEIIDPVIVEYRQNYEYKGREPLGHAGRYVFGELAGKRVMAMQGRLHCYQGYTMEQVAFPVRLAKMLGAESMIITNAAGCVNADWHVGELMLIRDHIRLFGFGPLNGDNLDEFGVRFPDMSEVYSNKYAQIAKEAAKKQGITLREGTYMFFPGPQYETPAEIRAARVLGADAVGMSTVPESTVAAHCGMKTLGITLLTNMAAGVLKQKLSGEEVIAASAAAAPRFSELIRGFLANMDE
ncbi:MAG: purine-nucleoside phosphorylase [Eubacteriales bacterium]|nr:purine-nucleoside phosphorylase [Eubacteriales bacterium]